MPVPQIVRNQVFTPLDPGFGWNNAYWVEDPAWTNPGADADVTSWRDAGSEAIDVTDGGLSTRRPVYRAAVAALNNRPAIEFNGTADNLQGSSAPTYTGPVTFVFVGNYRIASVTVSGMIVNSGSGADNALLDVNSTGDSFRVFSTSALNHGTDVGTTGHICIAVAASGANASSIGIDGGSDTLGNTGTTTLGTVRGIGANTARTAAFASMNAAFIGVKAGTLTTEQKTMLVAWSRHYYGTP